MMISGGLGTRSIGQLWVGGKADVSKLTAKQEQFIAALFAGSKPSQAYHKAFQTSTMSADGMTWSAVGLSTKGTLLN
jgi:hypothetical protein